MFGEPKLVSELMDAIKQEYAIRDLGFPANLLGFQLRRTPDYLEISCPNMIDSMMSRFNINTKMVTTPAPSTSTITSTDHCDTKPDSTLFRQFV